MFSWYQLVSVSSYVACRCDPGRPGTLDAWLGLATPKPLQNAKLSHYSKRQIWINGMFGRAKAFPTHTMATYYSHELMELMYDEYSHGHLPES